MEEIQKVQALKEKIISLIENASNVNELKTVQETHLSKKSELNSMMSLIRNLNNEDKILFGQAMNNARNEINTKYNEKLNYLNELLIKEKLEKESIDITLPGMNYQLGGINPFYQIQDEIMDIFVSMGYEIVEGPDVETDYYNFERMNIPANNPAREM